eukprot:m.163025 g.163025  ORF g.163025 m.163025 type:complete len:307 (-) comp24903_c0_seq6:53-973(-)
MTFPILNVLEILQLVNQKDSQKQAAPPKTTWYAEILIRHLRFGTYIALAIIYHYTFSLHWIKEWPPWQWIGYIFVRNWTFMAVLYGGWHWFLYELMRDKLAHKKFNPKFPSPKQHSRDRFWTSMGFAISSIFEVCVLYAWAHNMMPLYTSFWAFPAYSLFHLLLIPYWRDFHFFWIHILMHPWNIQESLDFGAFLYKHVHSLHHKSYNTGPWSGLAMHPVEHFIYYSCTLLPFIFTLHPIHFWMNKLHADFSPLPGHDGFDKPAGGSQFHHLHHAHYECNYGTPMVPLDKLFGTYEDGSRWAKDSN